MSAALRMFEQVTSHLNSALQYGRKKKAEWKCLAENKERNQYGKMA